MNNRDQRHPSEEALTAFALDGVDSAIAAHCKTCDDCRGIVDSLKGLRSELLSLDEEVAVPDIRRALIHRDPRSFGGRLFDSLSGVLLRNYLVFPLLYVVYISCAYFLFAYLNDLALMK